ncbi:MAG: terminase gpA endonuclease subunit [Pseudomonadota bacterium]
MGFLTPAARAVYRAAAQVMSPPPPPDISRWCEENIVFDERSPLPGPYRADRFPFLREIHDVLSPEHPCREVTIVKSAQTGGTVSLVQPTIGAWHEYGPVDSLVVHPTTSSATEWVNNKWLPMRRQTPSLRRIFGDGRGNNTDNTFNQETLNRNGSLKVASAGSPDDLAGTSRRLVIGDDLSKFEMNDKGDPEAMMRSRASAFEDAKLLWVSTPLIKGACRITRNYQRSDQRQFHVPCPQCGHEAPLTWENFRRSIDPERLHAAHFTCDSCGAVIDHSFKMQILQRGRWVAHNPRGDHPGFYFWRAMAPQRDWASIAVDYAQTMGWTRMTVSAETESGLQAQVEAATEQTFYNDVLGLPFEQASKGPDWTALRDRAENADPSQVTILPRGVLPASGFVLCAGVDCQQDRIEVQIVAFERKYRRRTIDYIVIPHHIGDAEGRAALDALLSTTWRTQNGLRVALDMLAIDVGTYTEDVWAFGKRHPWTRVILVKGASSQNGPVMAPMRFERRKDGQAKRSQKRAFMLNVSQMKADFCHWLSKDDPIEQGFCQFAAGLGDEYYRQITAEVRTLKRTRAGAVTSQWDLVEPTRRNEGLDTALYAEAAARRRGWTSMTEEQWDRLTDERAAVPPEAQGDLFDASIAVVAEGPPEEIPPAPAPAPARKQTKASPGAWIKPRGTWI